MGAEKIISFQQAKDLIESRRHRGEICVYVSGVFDVLHIGHVRFLQAAKALANVLFIGLETDVTARNTRGPGRPFNQIEYRLEMLAAMEYVDYIFSVIDSVESYATGGPIFANRLSELKPHKVALSIWDPYLEIRQEQILTAGALPALVDIDIMGSDKRRLSSSRYIRLFSLSESNE